jgi:uncharacterized lipoprotein YmbA
LENKFEEKMKNQKVFIYIFFAAFAFALYSCGSSKPFQRYILVPVAERENAGSGKTEYSKIIISAGIIELPEYLSGPKITSFKKSNELYMDEYNRWASSLKGNFEKVLLEDISAYIPTDNIAFYGVDEETLDAFRINALVTQFGLQADSSIVLNARWGVPKGKDIFTLDKKSFISEDGKGADYNAQAQIMSALTAKLAKEIAEEIRKKYDAVKK